MRWPHAEACRDAHVQPDSVLSAGLRTQARAGNIRQVED